MIYNCKFHEIFMEFLPFSDLPSLPGAFVNLNFSFCGFSHQQLERRIKTIKNRLSFQKVGISAMKMRKRRWRGWAGKGGLNGSQNGHRAPSKRGLFRPQKRQHVALNQKLIWRNFPFAKPNNKTQFFFSDEFYVRSWLFCWHNQSPSCGVSSIWKRNDE